MIYTQHLNLKVKCNSYYVPNYINILAS